MEEAKQEEKIIEAEVVQDPTPPTEPPKPEPERQQDKKETKALAAIPIGPDGRIAVRDNAELLRYCGAMVQAGMVPARFDTPQKLFGALMFARELRLPDTAIRQIAIVEGTPSIFGDLPLALVQAGGELKKFREIWFDKDYAEIRFENKNLNAEVWGAVCFCARGDGEVQSFSYTLDDARKAGQYPAKKRNGEANPHSPWEKHTRIMLRYKARAIALKSLFADKVNGVGIIEYDHDILGTEDMSNVRDVTGHEASVSALNQAAEAG